MARYEYKVVPAPSKGRKARGVKTPEGRFALSIEDVLNQMGEEGWEYLRAELLPSEERSGLTSSITQWRNVLVFRRALDPSPEHAFAPTTSTTPAQSTPEMTAAPAAILGATATGAASVDVAEASPLAHESADEPALSDPFEEPGDPPPIDAAPEWHARPRATPPDLSVIENQSPPDEPAQEGARFLAETRDSVDEADVPSSSDVEPVPDDLSEEERDALSGIEKVVRRSAELKDRHSDD